MNSDHCQGELSDNSQWGSALSKIDSVHSGQSAFCTSSEEKRTESKKRRMISISCDLSQNERPNQTVSVEIASSDTVADLKRSLFDKFGIRESDEKDFSLLCGSKTIDDLEQKLSDTEICVDQDAKITLVQSLAPGEIEASAAKDEKRKEVEMTAEEAEEAEDKKSWWMTGKGGTSNDTLDRSDENSPNNCLIGPVVRSDRCSTSPVRESNGKGSKFGNNSINSGGFFKRWMGLGNGGNSSGGGGGSNYSYNISDDVYFSRSGVAGLVGLGNLGNTCYMNSSLQCLLHTRPLMDLFLSHGYKKDINRNNPLGQKGELAEAFGSLMANVWKEGVSHVSPRGFKSKIGTFSTTFSGYGQQDSQELLAFLMDGLHEDLNRVLEKPYVKERDDADKLPDDELARVTWEGHLQRNDSVIVDRCLGMYRSTLTCPTCHKTSKKFDPIMYLSLPLPESKVKTCNILLVATDGSKPPTKYCIDVPSISSIRDLVNSLAALAGIEVAPPASASAAGSTVSLEALAAIAESSPSLPQAEDLICLTKYKDDLWRPELTVLLPKSRVSEHMPSTSTSSWQAKEYFVAYLFPSAAQGPKNEDLSPLIVYQTVSSTAQYSSNYTRFSSIPLLTFVPKGFLAAEEVEKLSHGYSDSCFQINEDSRIFRTVKQALAPVLVDVDHPTPSPDPLAAVATDREMEDAPPTPSHPLARALDNPTTNENLADPEDNSSAKMSVSGFQPSAPVPEPFYMFPDQPPLLELKPKPEPCPFKLFISRSSDNRGPEKGFGKYYDQDEPWTSDLLILEWQNVKDPPFVYEEHESHKVAMERGKEGRRPVNLDSCFEAFLQPEQLGEDDSWFCPTCKVHVQADKKLDLWALPEVLVIHLKRFYFTRSSRDKLTTKVDFPLHGLDLSPYLLRPEVGIPPVYDCYAVSNHFGGMGGGHYTAYAKSPDSDEWHLFDDSHVSDASADEVVSPAAYVLFYRRRHEADRDQSEARPGAVSSMPNDQDMEMAQQEDASGEAGALNERFEDMEEAGAGDIIKADDDDLYADLDGLDEAEEIHEEAEDGEDENNNNMMSTSP